jgi:hypothetical protein
MALPLVQFTDLATSVTNTAQVEAMNAYFTLPLVTMVFGVAVIIAGLTITVGVVLWMTGRIGNMFGRHDLRYSEHRYAQQHHRLDDEMN